jgi:hypothetical protein
VEKRGGAFRPVAPNVHLIACRDGQIVAQIADNVGRRLKQFATNNTVAGKTVFYGLPGYGRNRAGQNLLSHHRAEGFNVPVTPTNQHSRRPAHITETQFITGIDQFRIVQIRVRLPDFRPSFRIIQKLAGNVP